MSEANKVERVVICLPQGWHIEHNPKPGPYRNWDYDFWHEDYDYCSETGGNGLCGCAANEADAIEQIKEIEADLIGI